MTIEGSSIRMARDPMPFPEFYARVVAGYHGAQVNNHPGDRPRGAFTRGKPGEITLLAVLQNPGQPLPIETELQGTSNGRELAEIVWNSSGDVFEGRHRSRTLSRMQEDVSHLLDASPAEAAYQFMFTNLVRCTTKNNKRPDREALDLGAEWLREELDLWRPKYVIAYGNTVAETMMGHGLRVDAILPHPAALGKELVPGRRRARLAEVRQQLGL